MLTFSERLKELRKSKNLTQNDMAKSLQITTRHYQDCEYGKVTPNAIMLIKLADYYNVSIDYLLGRTDTPDRI